MIQNDMILSQQKKLRSRKTHAKDHPKCSGRKKRAKSPDENKACMSSGMQGIQRRELMKKHRRETGHEPLRDCGETPMVKEQDHRSPTARLPAGGDG
jgi:hypothetical protein